MTIPEIMERMIVQSAGNRHDISHLIKVHDLARTIALIEGMEGEELFCLEAAAIVHDIACPLCRKKYGSCPGKLQERESEPLVRAFFAGCDLAEGSLERIVHLVCHHHTYVGVDGMDWQVLLEADFLVNADESGYAPQAIAGARERIFATETGRRLLDAMYPEAAALS